MKDTRFASIDIGSHTCRLLIVGLSCPNSVYPILHERHITRLARGFLDRQTLQKEAMDRTIEILSHYCNKLRTYNVSHVVCGATGVVRRARNKDQFLQKIKSQVGMDCRILSEVEEAKLSVKGIMSVLPFADMPTLCFDLGGSTTEFALVHSNNKDVAFTTSLFLGAATITEGFLEKPPVSKNSIETAKEYILSQLVPLAHKIQNHLKEMGFSKSSTFRLVGTAGTVTTLAAMRLRLTNYQPRLINGTILDKNWISELMEEIRKLPFTKRRSLPGLEPGREDIILGGMLIVACILEAIHRKELIAVDAGLLEGLVMEKVTAIRPELGVNSLTLAW